MRWSLAAYRAKTGKKNKLAKLIGISWPTVRLVLKKRQTAMGNPDSIYQMNDWLEVDDALVGGKRSEKRGRGAHGKTPVMVACENTGEHAGFMAMKAVIQVYAGLYR